MHDTAYHIGTMAMNIYSDLASASVLEIGSLSVNGSLRDNALPTTRYVGVDLEEGDGVDIVIKPGESLPVEDKNFDLVIASSVFEHDPCFWLTFLEMCRATKDGGYIYINAPSNGFVHRFPQDNWRFYPDSGLALTKWAISQGHHITLMESFVAERDADIWNDFVAVFRKGKITSLLPSTFLHEHVPSVNVRTWKSKELLRQRNESQDSLLLSSTRAEAEAATQQIAQINSELSSANDRVQQLELSLADLATTRHDLAQRESELRQRQDEIQQTGIQLAEAKSERDAIAGQLMTSEQREEDLARELAGRENEWNRATQRWEKELANTRDQASQLREQLHRATRAEQDAAKLVLRSEQDQRQTAERTAQAENRLAGFEAQQAERFRELSMLTGFLKQQEERGDNLTEHLAWAMSVQQCIQNQPRWWHLMPATWREQKQRGRLKRANLFDHESYYQQYPDVAAAGIDALEHYLRHGVLEGRSKSF